MKGVPASPRESPAGKEGRVQAQGALCLPHAASLSTDVICMSSRKTKNKEQIPSSKVGLF